MKNLRLLLFTIGLLVLSLFTQFLQAQDEVISNLKINPDKELNPNAQWMSRNAGALLFQPGGLMETEAQIRIISPLLKHSKQVIQTL